MYIILAMTMFPQIAVLSGLYAVINTLGIPAIPSLIVTYLLFSLPFTAWVLTAFFRELPTEIFQSAQVDGASPFQTFYMIMLPLTAPALVTTGLLAFIGAWNEYLFALTFTSVNARRAHAARDHRQLPGAVLPADSLWRDHGCGYHLQYPAVHPGLHLPAPHRRRSDGGCGEGIRTIVNC